MNLFGRKSAGRALARPALARAFSWNVSDIPRSYEAQVRAAMLDNPVAQRAVRMVSQAVGGAPLAGSNDVFTRLVQTTSAGQSLLESVAAQLLLHGNAYIQILCGPDGAPRELYALRPERVSVEGDGRGWPVAYNYRANEATARMPADSVIHIKAMHPLDDHYGLGCLGAATGAVAIHNAATLWNKALLDNAARPSGALVHEAGEALSADQFDRLQSELTASFSGGGNAGRPMLLEGGLRWQSLSLSPADKDFAGLKAAAAREIALAFGVPPVLLGLPGDATYSNYREANRALWRQTVLPLAGKILSAVRQGLVAGFPEAVLEVDLDRVTELSEDRERLWVMVEGAGFMTLDEKREMVGLEALVAAAGNGADVVPPPAVPPPPTEAPAEMKYNQNHDPANGQFTYAAGGGSSDGGGSISILASSVSDIEPPATSMAKRPVVRTLPTGERRVGKVIVNRPTFTYQIENLNGKGYTPKPDDANLLARIIYAESLSNPEDFAAIGWATVNRVGVRQHGMTLDGVLRKPGRYAILAVGGGPKGDSKQWNETADPSKLEGDKLAGWQQALAVANGIVKGNVADPTGGATYFISSDKYVRGSKITEFPFFTGTLKSGRLIDSSYISGSTRKRQNHFFIEVPTPPATPKTIKPKR